MKSLKNRYLSLKLEGHEIYTESVGMNGDLHSHAMEALTKLSHLKEAFPQGLWEITIEEEDKNGVYYILDIQTGVVTKNEQYATRDRSKV